MTLDSPFTERQENHSEIISCTLTFVIGSMTQEVICAVGEIELSEIDCVTADEDDPERDPQRFTPEVTRRNHAQQV